ncbi:hypothetical protein AKJ53_01235 [candidate division MSBL1 archaeon SCGC-AAA382F02]|uniref:2-amino-5-formylamino-6-ribosylaminopyrimidin-4(3H)-one 5'-monophosphate deformylase n=1 Tax=candidate division MSBL1 archaeon SCGC-AAA382F02 TaxID=1698282 RepID=A0A133VI99_9EURY|nr:hypothetical protein AKJ53_01235 [candidate division MSBL1 archaeon SCGC-AAA382F02]
MKVGIIALGSHKERHGAALPPDTDAKIAEHIALETARKTDAEFLGTLKSSYELPEINTGDHQPIEEVIEELKDKIQEVKAEGFEGLLIVNGHGGNQELENHLEEVEKEMQIKLRMDSTICQIEGPHAGTGELSIGSILGITDESQIEEHQNPEKHPEVGFAGFEKVREKYDWAEDHAQEVINEGVRIDESIGKDLLDSAISNAAEKTREMGS